MIAVINPGTTSALPTTPGATWSAASPSYITALTINNGKFVISGSGTVGSAAVATTVTAGGVFTIDDTGTAIANRLNNGGAASVRTMNLSNGTFNYVANGTSASVESMGR